MLPHEALVGNTARDEGHPGALLRIPTGVEEMQGLAHVVSLSPKLWFPVTEVPSACLMVKTVKLLRNRARLRARQFLEDKQTVDIIQFKVISESAAMGVWLLLQLTGRRSFRGGFQERDLRPGGM